MLYLLARSERERVTPAILACACKGPVVISVVMGWDIVSITITRVPLKGSGGGSSSSEASSSLSFITRWRFSRSRWPVRSSSMTSTRP